MDRDVYTAMAADEERHWWFTGRRAVLEALISRRALPRGPVLDVGCGFGDTALQLARKVGPNGHVTGVDCCDAFLAEAQKEAAAAGAGNIDFLRADAEKLLPRGEYDFVFARFGTMFFANPVAGLRNMREALRPGGRMVHIVWRNRADNPWLSMALLAAAINSG